MRRRRTIGAPCRDGHVEMVVGDVDARWLPSCQPFRLPTADDEIRLDEFHLRGQPLVGAHIVQQANQVQLRIRARIDPQFDRVVCRAELDQPKTFSARPFEPLLRRMILPVKPVFLRRARREVRVKFCLRKRRSSDKPSLERDHKVGETRGPNAARARTIRRQNETLHAFPTRSTPNENGRQRRRQLSVLSARSFENSSRFKAYSSVGSSPSASRSAAPARICSAIRPEFWRIAVSILAVMSGLAFRNAFAFSRPWPRRWLS